MRLYLFLAGAALLAQTPKRLSLPEAEALAIRNHPRVAAARLNAEAANETTKQFRSALSPVFAVNVTGSLAENGTRIGAGALNPSSLFSRTAAGFSINQILWDFGRVRSLTASAQSRASAQGEAARAVNAEILLRVREAWYRALLAQSQLRVFQETVEARRVTSKQITALAQSNLRSTLDVSFAELNLAEAELALDRSQNDVRSAAVFLAAALGVGGEQVYELQEDPLPPDLEGAAERFVAQAIASRPDLAALRLQSQSAKSFADSERRQSLPNLTAMGVAGAFGPKDAQLHPHYAGVGVNLNIPVWNGGLFASRRQEAELRAQIADQDTRDLELRITRDVRAAWIDADNAQKRLALTAKVVTQAQRTMRLAQTRYDLGLSNIVELSQAQLSRTAAEVVAVAARFDYLLKRAVLDYHAGNLR